MNFEEGGTSSQQRATTWVAASDPSSALVVEQAETQCIVGGSDSRS